LINGSHPHEERVCSMSKIKLLLNVVDDLHSLAESLQAVAECLEENDMKDVIPQKPTEPTVSIEELRAILADKSSEGKTVAVKALLVKYADGKLSSVKPEDYAALMEEVRKL